jgi:hypothetical protein
LLNAFHINWTAPHFLPSNDEIYSVDDSDILTTILSALKWRQYNGSIKMYTDDTAAEYYDKLGIIGIWDRGVDTSVLKNFPYTINPQVFWAVGKLIALKHEEVPCVMLDTDLVVWQPIEDKLDTDIVVLHRENLRDYSYPNANAQYIPPE